MAVHAGRSDAAAVKLPVFFRFFVLDGHLRWCKGKKRHQRGSATSMSSQGFHLNEWTGVFQVICWPVSAMNTDGARPRCRIAPERKK
jgi:hypothetical protein